MTLEKITKLIDSGNREDVILGIELAYKHISWEEFDSLLDQNSGIFKERILGSSKEINLGVHIFEWGGNSFILDIYLIWRIPGQGFNDSGYSIYDRTVLGE